MNLYENIKTNLKESIGYNLETTKRKLARYYCEKTGATIVSDKEAHRSGGGLSNTDYSRVQFSDGTTITLLESFGKVIAIIKNTHNTDPNGYKFEVYENDDSYKDKLGEYIEDGYIENSHSGSFKYLDDYFAVSDAIENKGDEVMSLEDSGDNKEELIKKINELDDDFPAIIVSGLWNDMSDGSLTTAKSIKDILKNKDSIYGGRDSLTLYDNLIYLKIVSGSEMW